MLVVIVLMTMAVAEFIPCAITVALDRMDQVVLTEEVQRTEDVRLVDSADLPFQLSQRLRLHGSCQSLHYHNTVGCGLHIMLFEQSDAGRFVHSDKCFVIFGYKVTK
jgi:hypothetical protein